MREMNLLEHWEVVRLGDVCNIIMGQSPPSTTYNDDGVGMPFLQGKAEFTELFPVPTKYCTKRLRVSPKGSVLMSVRAPVGDVNLGDREYIIGRGLTSISLKHGNNHFLFYLLLHNKKEIEAKGYGSTFKSINKTTVNDFQIALPPLPEQRAIAHVLQTIQEAKAARQRELTLERERKAALMDYLFSYGTKGEPRKQTEIGEIPESWAVMKLGQLCRVFSGHGFKTKDYTQEGIPLIKIGNLQDGEVVINPNNDYMPESWQQKEQLQKFILKSKDILIALTGATTGKTAVVPPSLEGTFLNQRVGKIELISPNAEQDFILGVIKTRFFQEAIQQNILRSAQGNISPSSIAQIPIPLPLLPEQRTIASVFSGN